MRKFILALVLLTILMGSYSRIHAAEIIQPFILASETVANLENCTNETIDTLQSNGFEVVGQYSPFSNTTIIVVTNPALKAAAAQSTRGAYAAGQRISLNQIEDKVEVSFVNPVYIQHAYRVNGDLKPVQESLKQSLGYVHTFGVEKSKTTAEKLAKYHYTMGMQYFDDPSELATFDNYQQAVDATQKALNKNGDALDMVYRIDIPGTEQTVFGVSMKATTADEEDLDDAHQLSIVDFVGPKKSAYLPYEILVTGNKVEALHMRFRMAVHFPDLSMMGKNSFMKLMSSPKAIEGSLENLFVD